MRTHPSAHPPQQSLDDLKVRVEITEAGSEGQGDRWEHLQSLIAERLRAEILTRPKVEICAPGSLPVSEGKAKRVIDNRSL